MIIHLLAKNIKYYRLQKSWSQEKLAEKAKCSRNNISDIENEIYPPTLAKVESIANALEIDIYKLFLP